ncbi:MAG TPA: hypothetical protein VGS28_02405 [Candidatus Saccharimonadales bacterium]|nr:hypothetical protein [Candidatus Saccharimonadales bacterium]
MSNLHLKSNPTLSDIQKYVIDLEKERGFNNSLTEDCLLLIEEVGELCKVVRKSPHTSMGIDVNKTYEFDTGGEIADVLIMLTAIANKLGVDMEAAFREKEERNKLRTWL